MVSLTQNNHIIFTIVNDFYLEIGANIQFKQQLWVFSKKPNLTNINT